MRFCFARLPLTFPCHLNLMKKKIGGLPGLTESACHRLFLGHFRGFSWSVIWEVEKKVLLFFQPLETSLWIRGE
jgi:hypothetical protein